VNQVANEKEKRMKNGVEVFNTGDELQRAGAEWLIAIAREAVAERGRFVLSLSGGQTLNDFYSFLATPAQSVQIDWLKTFIFWSDERYVLFDNDANYAHKTVALLFNKIGIPSTNIHVINTNLQPDQAAAEYEEHIDTFFNNQSPRCDLILLGLEEDGHTAALFPGSALLHEQRVGVRQVYVETEKRYRITMTAPLINQARHILFLVMGKEKAAIVKENLAASHQPDRYPSQLIKPVDGELRWYVDKEAAALLTENTQRGGIEK
jgi:6-phosphogluconolactonase